MSVFMMLRIGCLYEYLSPSQVLQISLDHLLDPTQSLAASQGKGLEVLNQ